MNARKIKQSSWWQFYTWDEPVVMRTGEVRLADVSHSADPLV